MGAEQPKDPRPAPAAEPSKPSGKLRTRIVARPGHGIIVVGLGSGARVRREPDSLVTTDPRETTYPFYRGKKR